MQTALYLIVMALSTYLIRMLPFTIFRKKIKSKFIKSVLAYIPYSVLAAMTIPAIFTSVGNVFAAAGGFVAGSLAAYFKRSLLTVAIVTCVTAYAILKLSGVVGS